MSEGVSWGWSLLFLLGVYHGVNPGMGWLFAVALGLQEKSGQATAQALLPIGLGHALAIGVAVALGAVSEMVVPLGVLKFGLAGVLFAFGVNYLLRARHPRWGGMQVGFADLTFWSFLMASAHGAGLMVVPIFLGLHPNTPAGHRLHVEHQLLLSHLNGSWTAAGAVLVHSAGYLLTTGLVAWVVYQKLGVAFLRKAWINLDRVWAIVLMATGVLTLVV